MSGSLPRNLDEVEHHEHVKKLLNSVKSSWQLPNLLLHGPAGTGKSSIILAFAREVFGPSNLKHRLLELNASDERGIDMIRDRVKTWSKLMTSGSTQSSTPTNNSTPPWKIIVLDEADMMTPDAQSALRRVMEDTARNTRFVIICNYISKIIDPVASRCVKCRFQPIPKETQLKKLSMIASKEVVDISDDALETLTRISKGDLRLAINLLQSTAAGQLQRISSDSILAISGCPPDHLSDEIIACCTNKMDIASMLALTDDIRRGGWDVNILLEQIVIKIAMNCNFPDVVKAKICLKLSSAQELLSGGASECSILYHTVWELSQELMKRHD